MRHFLLFYDYAPDYLERRGAHRAAHFARALPAVDRGELFLAGACTDDGPPIGVLVFKVADRKTVEDFARADPYVTSGVATSWHVREWTTVVGPDALTKVTPEVEHNREDHEGATEGQTGDRSGPGAGYDDEPEKVKDEGGVS
jgi:uncharacterized protein YciI